MAHGGFCVATPFLKAVTTPLPYPISNKGGYFEKQSFSVADVKNKIAQKHDELKKEHPGITDFFVSMTKNNSYLTWEFDPIDLNTYVPPKSTKDICIDELNKLIENNEIKEKT